MYRELTPSKRVIFKRNQHPEITNSPVRDPEKDFLKQPQVNRAPARVNHQFDPYEKEETVGNDSLVNHDILVNSANGSKAGFLRNRVNPLTLNGYMEDFQDPKSPPRATFPLMSMANSSSISNEPMDMNLHTKDITPRDYDKYLAYNKKGILSKYPAKKLQRIAKMMGGPENFSKHFGLVPYEINQIFPPILKR